MSATYSGQAPCPHCFESSGYEVRVHPATWYEPAWEDSDPTRPCPYCNATGTVDSELVTLEDLEELALEEIAALKAIMAKPHGCVYCDNGVLRLPPRWPHARPDQGHEAGLRVRNG